MCGIAGIIHRTGKSRIGAEMTAMLQAMKHRGPDSTGVAVYGAPAENRIIMRLKLAEQEDLRRDFEARRAMQERRAQLDAKIAAAGAAIVSSEAATEYAFRYEVRVGGDLKRFCEHIEEVEGAEILSIGHAIELVKDLGDAAEVGRRYGLDRFVGTHAIGHVRMATESDVDICSAHPFWAYPFKDVSIVHNGQLTNYWSRRRGLERRGHRFMSDCDSELIAVYLADKLDRGVSLEDAMKSSIDEFDGVFTYLVATSDSLGMAKDVMAAKPMVLYEGKDAVAMASEEVAIRTVFPMEIDTMDPYDGEVRVWKQ
jgi:glutamate synthase domain-containing protein 1